MHALDLVRITPNFSFRDLSDKQGLEPKIYQDMVETWMIRPVEALLKNYPPDSNYRGMAALAIALQFFEQHGEFLTGESSRNRSREFFCRAFDKVFKKGSPPSEMVYKWARCGLFHSACLSHELLIDAAGLGRTTFSNNPMIPGGWLVNPLLLVGEIRSYVEQYRNELESEPNKELAVNFRKRFKDVITEPLNFFGEKLGY